MKLLLATHGEFCEGILNSFRMIAGQEPDIDTIKLTNDGGIEKFSREVDNWFQKNLGEDKLVLCDLKGGTPYNECYRHYLEDSIKTAVISGLNLAMLIEVGLASMNNHSLSELSVIAKDAGLAGISIAEVTIDEEDIDF